MKRYQVQTVFEKGFDNKKYQEALFILDAQNLYAKLKKQNAKEIL